MGRGARKADRRGLTIARYVKTLMDRDVSDGEKTFTALTPEEQRELLEGVRELRGLLKEEVAAPARDEESAREPQAASGAGMKRRPASRRPRARRMMPVRLRVPIRRSRTSLNRIRANCRPEGRAAWSPRSTSSSPPPSRCRITSATGITPRTIRSTVRRASGTTRRRRRWACAPHVRPSLFEDVLSGWVPGTDIYLGRMHEGEYKHRPGWDITFSAPKSVSLEALAIGDRRVIRAHDEAVRATLAWVEAELLETRGWDPATRRRPRVKAEGMVVAGFRHLTSRDQDPQLHTHRVLANMTRTASGEWRSVEPTKIRRSQKLIGAYYRNELARRLQALGMAVAPRMVGPVPGFELAGYERSFLDALLGPAPGDPGAPGTPGPALTRRSSRRWRHCTRGGGSRTLVSRSWCRSGARRRGRWGSPGRRRRSPRPAPSTR